MKNEEHESDIQWQVVKKHPDGHYVISAGLDHSGRIVLQSNGAWIEGGELVGGWWIHLGEGEEDLLRSVIEDLYEMHGWDYEREAV